MALKFEVTLDGLPQLVQDVRAIRSRLNDRRPALRFIGEELLVVNENRLARGVDFEGRPMKPSRRAQAVGGQTMVDQGNLQGSLHTAVQGGDLELFSSDIRAAVHWYGKTIKPKAGEYLTIVFQGEDGLEFRKVREVEMPERRWFGINESGDLAMVEDVMGGWVLEGRLG